MFYLYLQVLTLNLQLVIRALQTTNLIGLLVDLVIPKTKQKHTGTCIERGPILKRSATNLIFRRRQVLFEFVDSHAQFLDVSLVLFGATSRMLPLQRLLLQLLLDASVVVSKVGELLQQ